MPIPFAGSTSNAAGRSMSLPAEAGFAARGSWPGHASGFGGGEGGPTGRPSDRPENLSTLPETQDPAPARSARAKSGGPQASHAPSLVTVANSVSSRPDRAALRSLRYRLRLGARRILPKERVARCGRSAHGLSVQVRHDCVRGATYSGLVTCGSVWDCPVCAAKISEKRRQELELIVTAHLATGGAVYMAALTVPHARLHSAEELRQLVADCWRKTQAGEPWMREKMRAGLIGTVRACEVTHGENGWHPHLHVLFFIGLGIGETTAQAFGNFVFHRWSKFVRRAGYGECNPTLWRFERTRQTQRAGEYVMKW